MPGPRRKGRRKASRTPEQRLARRLLGNIDPSRLNARGREILERRLRSGVTVSANALPRIGDIIRANPMPIRAANASAISNLQEKLSAKPKVKREPAKAQPPMTRQGRTRTSAGVKGARASVQRTQTARARNFLAQRPRRNQPVRRGAATRRAI